MDDTEAQVAALTRRLDRERRARLESERIAEQTTRELYEAIQRVEQSRSELAEAAGLVGVLQQVAIAANEATTFDAAVEIALGCICRHTGWPVGHLYVADGPALLVPSAVWHIEGAGASTDFRVLTERMPLPVGVGLPGRVLESREPAWITDVTIDTNFPRANAAVEAHLGAGFAFPVIVAAEVVAVLEFFAQDPMEPNDALLTVMANVGNQLGRVVERTRAEEALRISEQRTREIIETANDAFVAVDANGRITDWNHQAERHFGWTREEAVGRLLTETIIPPNHRDAHLRGMARFLASGNGALVGRRVELEAMHRDGHRFPIELTPWAVAEGGTYRFNAFIHDITERLAFQRQLEHQSLHDDLTGLPNRALLLDRLQQAIDRSQRNHRTLAVCFVDLDRFKAVNDSLGHQAGDDVLIEVAARIPAVIRPGDTFARLSGDEFVVLCEDVPDRNTAIELADRILHTLAAPFQLGPHEAHISASIGVAFNESGRARAEDLLSDADIAMYRAKERGRNVCELFDESLRTRLANRMETERSLHRAIDEDQLVAYFQPVVDLRLGRMVAAEALVRWRHPERGLLLPGEFIALAEESALIGRLGRWMLRESCARLGDLRERHPGLDFSMAVNLSVSELEHPHLLTYVQESVDAHRVPPSALTFEITESAVMHDAEAVLRRLADLRELGVRLAIDDFGTGFSSLDRLRRMPVHALKVDRSFVAELDTTPGGTALVAAVIAMSHSLGLEVVAEGVETPAQLQRLQHLGCDYAQGYLLGRPAPFDALSEGLVGESLSEICRADRPPEASDDLYDEISRLLAHAVSARDDVERTARSLVAEIQRLLGDDAFAQAIH